MRFSPGLRRPCGGGLAKNDSEGPVFREWIATCAKAALIVAAGAALGLGVNAVSPRGIPLRPMTLPTDFPPPNGAPLTDGYITLDFVAAIAADPGAQKDTVLIDARAAHEYQDGHIPHAINIPLTDFLAGRPARLGQIPRDRLIIVYCEDPDCGASVTAAEQLRLYGYPRENVRVFTGGFPAWVQAGMEVAFD